MFKLRLLVDGVETALQSVSIQRLCRDVVDLFSPEDKNKIRIPFSGYLNGSGQIVEIKVESGTQNQAATSEGNRKIIAQITKVNVSECLDWYEIPDPTHHIEGDCWVAIKDNVVIDVVSMKVRPKQSFFELRSNAMDRLIPKGTVLMGAITAKKFFPKEPKKMKRN